MMSEEAFAEAVQLRKQGWTIKRIAEKYSVKTSTLESRFHRNGVTIRPMQFDGIVARNRDLTQQAKQVIASLSIGQGIRVTYKEGNSNKAGPVHIVSRKVKVFAKDENKFTTITEKGVRECWTWQDIMTKKVMLAL